MARTFSIAAAQCTAWINGVQIGSVTGFNWRSMENRREVYALDQNEPYELVPTQSRVQCTLRFVRTLNDGGTQGMGMSGGFDAMVRERYFQFMITERQSDTVLFLAQDCSIVDESWDIQNRSYIQGTVDFTALTWSNEAIPPPSGTGGTASAPPGSPF